MNDYSTADMGTCKVCLKEKVKRYAYTDKSCTRRFRDGVGGLWMGKTCPSCHREENARRMANRRAKALQEKP